MKHTEENERYVHVSYGCGKVFIEEGFYTKEEIEHFLHFFTNRDEALKASMKEKYPEGLIKGYVEV